MAQIIAGGRHLLGLIDEILDISRIETGRMALSVEPVPVTQVVGEAVEMVNPIAAARDIRITIEESGLGSVHVVGDHQRLTQALLNLLSNAVKYNDEGGVVNVSLHREDDRLEIRVRDTGVGIPEDKMERVFQPFDRLGAENTDVEGTGLGLALSKRMLEAMGGDLRVAESHAGLGTTFAIELPVAEDPVERLDSDGDPAISETSLVSGVVVYIEDNLANLRLIERVLGHRPGVDLVPATKGGAGLDLIRKIKPNLVLLDLHLPDMSGTEVLRILKEDPSTEAIPVVVLSADAMTERRRSVLADGAQEYLTKPVEIVELLRVLDGILPKEPPPAVA